MPDFQSEYNHYRRLIDQRLRILADEGDRKPRSIAAPLRYVLSGGGKRLRPVLLLLAYQAVKGDSNREVAWRTPKKATTRLSPAIDAAVAIEALHNFTLVHDDIMDRAPSRRGRATVHNKWDDNTAILVGDELVALAYRSILKAKTPRLREILRVFTECLLEVCEGQGYDKEFEGRSNVSLREYLRMIEKKTGRMLSDAAVIGGLLGGATERELRALKNYGEHLGRAFQIRDDLLDVTGGRSFGKRIGGDIVEGKKTYLLLTAYHLVPEHKRHLLDKIVMRRGIRKSDVQAVRKLYQRYGVLDNARREVDKNLREAQRVLANIKPSRAREMLRWVAEMLHDRDM